MIINKKATQKLIEWLLRFRQRHTFPGFIQVSSALMGLTSLFGMGRGGPHRNSHQKDL